MYVQVTWDPVEAVSDSGVCCGPESLSSHQIPSDTEVAGAWIIPLVRLGKSVLS